MPIRAKQLDVEAIKAMGMGFQPVDNKKFPLADEAAEVVHGEVDRLVGIEKKEGKE